MVLYVPYRTQPWKISSKLSLQLLSEKRPSVVQYCLMAKIGYTRKPGGQNRVPPSTLVPGRHFIGQRPPRPDSGRISNGSNRFWLLIPPSATRFQSHLSDYGRAIRPAAHTRTRHLVTAGRGGSLLLSTWSCVRPNFSFVV